MEININSYIPKTNSEGPGSRFCIWVQGCSIRCKNCANKHMWNSNLGNKYDVNYILKLINKYSKDIEGVTFLGGEPLDQIESITYLSKKIQEMNLTVLLFTGYEYQKIKSDLKVKKLIKNVDILIDGKFEEKKLDYSRPWVGSSNQKFYFFSNKYDKNIITNFHNKIEVRITKDNQIILNGMGNFQDIINNFKNNEVQNVI